MEVNNLASVKCSLLELLSIVKHTATLIQNEGRCMCIDSNNKGAYYSPSWPIAIEQYQYSQSMIVKVYHMHVHVWLQMS